MAAPIAWNCECGEPNSGRAGQPLKCKKCGKSWGSQPIEVSSSGIDPSPMSLHGVVKAQVAELDGIVSSRDDFDLVGERIKRWKKRAVAALHSSGLGTEANEFEELEPGSFQMGNPERNWARRVKLYRTRLLALAEELEQHPRNAKSGSGPAAGRPPLVPSAQDARTSGRKQSEMAELSSLVSLLEDAEAWFDRQRESGSYASADSWLRIDRVKSMGRRLLPVIARYSGQPMELLAGILEDGLTGTIPNREWQEFRAIVAQAVGRSSASPSTASSVLRRDEEGTRRHFFICYATEDKTEIAGPVADELLSAGRTVWFDEYELVVGDSLRARIDEGLSVSDVAVVILSHHFFSKDWPRRELDGLVALGKRLLPIWHGIGFQDVADFSPTLAGIYALKSSDGPTRIAGGLIKALTRAAPETRSVEARVPVGLEKSISLSGYIGGELSVEEREILVAAADDGNIGRFSSDQSGDWVRAGSRDFVDFEDSAVAAVYLEALEHLSQLGLVRRESKTLYSLTGKGFKLARALKASK